MKLQKGLAVLATLSLLGLSVACNDSGDDNKYDEGFAAGKNQGYTEGYDVGYDDGYADGDAAGYERAKAYFASADYNTGFRDGRALGTAEGYASGYLVGKADGKAQGYNQGYDAGYLDGEDAGWDKGYSIGYDDGSDVATQAAYDAGYDAGWDDGYDVGFDDGYYALSVAPTKKLKGYANVLSMFHNDLIDYSKIPAPKETKRGLVANGKLLFSDASVTNKDTLKRAAVVEQYLVVEMAKQVKGKFGLSAERSLQVAKAANHFRKYSSKRALTAEDTNAYASEIVGTDFKSVEKAFDASMKGDLSQMNKILDVAAEKNGVSPEKMNDIITKLFI